jgi:hypothetical protein
LYPQPGALRALYLALLELKHKHNIFIPLKYIPINHFVFTGAPTATEANANDCLFAWAGSYNTSGAQAALLRLASIHNTNKQGSSEQ